MDYPLLALLCLSPVSGQLAAFLLRRREIKSVRLSQLVIGIFTFLPSFVVLALAYLRHVDAFHP
jgi:hypothetical protein